MLRVYIAAAAAALAVIAALGVIAVAQERKIAALTAEKETLSVNLAAARDSMRKSDEVAKELSRTLRELRSTAAKTEDKINARITEKSQSDPCLNTHIDRGIYLWLRGDAPE